MDGEAVKLLKDGQRDFRALLANEAKRRPRSLPLIFCVSTATICSRSQRYQGGGEQEHAEKCE
jgi:hypothetical protein